MFFGSDAVHEPPLDHLLLIILPGLQNLVVDRLAYVPHEVLTRVCVDHVLNKLLIYSETAIHLLSSCNSEYLLGEIDCLTYFFPVIIFLFNNFLVGRSIGLL